MFSLIITVISIALTAALVVATLYYGGTAFKQGSASVTASRLINEGNQLRGAVALYQAEFGAGAVTTSVTTLGGLVTAGYLSSVPADFSATATISGDLTSVVADDVCAEVNKKAGNATAMFSCETAGSVSTFHFSL